MFLLAGCGKPGDDASNSSPPPNAASHARGFSSVKYYDAPFQHQMKWRLSGADAQQQQPSGLFVINQAKLESFTTNGAPQAVIEAPECVYDMQRNTVNSAGHLQMRNGDGKYRTDGDGFLWRQDDSFLKISNHVHTVIQTGTETKALL